MTKPLNSMDRFDTAELTSEWKMSLKKMKHKEAEVIPVVSF